MNPSKRVVITGGANGLGAALTRTLSKEGFAVWPYDIVHLHDVRTPDLSYLPEQVDILINAAAVNRIAWLDDVTDDLWEETISVNLTGMFRMCQALAPALRASQGTIVNIVSNAAHMPMRCSAAYNASKGGALILTKQLARELAPDVTVFSVSPNKLAGTAMSESIDQQVCETRGWTRQQAREYQLKGLLTGEETPVEVAADFITFLLSTKERHKYLTGCDIPYGA